MIIDGHCDTLSVALDENKSINNSEFSFNIQHAQNLKEPIIQIMAAFISPEKYVVKNTDIAWKRANNIIKNFYNKNINITQILNSKDIEKVERNKGIGVMLSIENGSAICGDLSKIDELYIKGIRMMSITWDNDNELGCGVSTTNDIGLTELGKKYIKKLNSKKIIIDVSHSSEKSFYEVIKNSSLPVVASHSCVKELCNHKRNLNVDQIKQIANLKGIIGICFYNEFLKNNKNIISSEDIVDHICYISNTVGVEYVGLGSDFDGVEKQDLPQNVKGIKDMYNIEIALERRGFTNKERKMIMGENWKRVINSII